MHYLHIAARKSDMWMVLDPETGRKLHSFTSDGTWSTCPSTEDHEEQNLLYLGRTGENTVNREIFVVKKSSSDRPADED